MGAISPTHLLLVLIVALIVIGPNRLPETGAALGKALRQFRDATNGIDPEANPTPTASSTPIAATVTTTAAAEPTAMTAPAAAPAPTDDAASAAPSDAPAPTDPDSAPPQA
jgi:sec-independent protein translocase protein TatA